MKIMVINGPNLNMLGIREPEIYGRETYGDLINMIQGEAAKLEIDVDFFQDNSEGAAISTMAADLFPMEPINMHFGKTGSYNGECQGNLLPRTDPRPMQ